MKSLNKSILNQEKFSNQLIGPLAYLVHKVKNAGKYKMEILQGKKLITQAEIDASEVRNKKAAYIDFAKLGPKSAASIKISSDGYLLFFNSAKFDEYRILIKNKKVVEFDSMKPEKGDIYSINLVRPGRYELKSKSLKTDLQIRTAYPNQENQALQATSSIRLAGSAVKQKKQQRISPNQGLNIELGQGFTDFNLVFKEEIKPKKEELLREKLGADVKVLMSAKRKKMAAAKRSTSKKSLQTISKKFIR